MSDKAPESLLSQCDDSLGSDYTFSDFGSSENEVIFDIDDFLPRATPPVEHIAELPGLLKRLTGNRVLTYDDRSPSFVISPSPSLFSSSEGEDIRLEDFDFLHDADPCEDHSFFRNDPWENIHPHSTELPTSSSSSAPYRFMMRFRGNADIYHFSAKNTGKLKVGHTVVDDHGREWLLRTCRCGYEGCCGKVWRQVWTEGKSRLNGWDCGGEVSW